MNVPQPTLTGVLVIGYGNSLRGDDGLGPHIAAAIAAQWHNSVRVLTVHQLLPEIAADLATADHVLFVDASVDAARPAVDVVRVEANIAPSSMTHLFTPGTLLALSEVLYGRSPEAWLVSVRGESFELGTSLSAVAHRRAAIAVQRVETLLERLIPSPSN